MAIVFDPVKSRRNERERNLLFESAERFDFATADYKIDDREDYGESLSAPSDFSMDTSTSLSLQNERMIPESSACAAPTAPK